MSTTSNFCSLPSADVGGPPSPDCDASSASSQQNDVFNNLSNSNPLAHGSPIPPNFNSGPVFIIPNYNPGPEFPDVPLPPSGVGSFEYDLNHGYTLRWTSLASMKAWMKQECLDKSIEFVKRGSPQPGPGFWWSQKIIYVCSRQGSGGKSHYQPTKGWGRKISSKRTGCSCRLTVKTYPETSEVLGLYNSDHSHPVGDENLKYTRLDVETRREIENYLRLGVEPKKVLELITKNMYHENNLAGTRSNKAHRRHFATRADVRRIQKMIEEEAIRLASQDGPSVLEWVKKLQAEGHFVSLKRSDQPPPAGSELEEDSFVLIIQTKYQHECWQKFGSQFAGIDGTHNTTHYEGMTLFTLMVRDKWGHGMPASWMISSNAKEVTIDYYLSTIRTRSPGISPNLFMSDYDNGQLNAIQHRFPKSRRLLCWWHVLHAWQQHFVTHHHPVLWERLKRWIRITDQDEFDRAWAEIQSIAPPSVVDYLITYWMKVVELWSAVFRRDRHIFELGDTNMLVEAWHHLLKGTFLEGKRNRRLDHLIHVLYDVAIPHFTARHRRQEMGFEGPDLELKHRMKVMERAASIPKSDIQFDADAGKYIIRSQSDPEIFYEVDLNAYDCTCLSFPLIHFCKHICAVQQHFPEDTPKIPVATLNTSDGDDDDDDDVDGDSSDTESLSDTNDLPECDAVIEGLTERLQSLALRFRLDPPIEPAEDVCESMRQASHVLDSLSTQLPSSQAVLSSRKEKIAANQHSWPETSAVMGTQVKNKKRKEYGPYGGNEAPGKKARLDARGPSSSEPAVSGITVDSPSTLPPQETSYYRQRAHRPAPPVPGSSSLPPSLDRPATVCHSRPSFDVDTFDLAKLEDDTVDILSSLNANQLRALCAKYGVETTRKNEVMVTRLRTHRLRLRNPPQSRPIVQSTVPTYPAAYSTYQYFPNYYYPMYPASHPPQ